MLAYVLLVVVPLAAPPLSIVLLALHRPMLHWAFTGALALSMAPLVVWAPAFIRCPAVGGWFAAGRETARQDGVPAFVVSVQLVPLGKMGLSKLLDANDDVGLLLLEPDGLRLEGDAVQLFVPWNNVEGLQRAAHTPRSFWLLGRGVRLRFFSPFDELEGLVLQIREGWTCWGAWRRGNELAAELATRPAPGFAPATSAPPRPDDDNPYRSAATAV